MPRLNDEIILSGGIYKRYSKYLEKLGILKFEDFLYHIPSRYKDYSVITNIADAKPGEIVTIKGNLEEIKNEYTRRHIIIQRGTVKDETGTIEIIWFNQPYIPKALKKGDYISISGEVEIKGRTMQMVSPDFEQIYGSTTIHTGRLVPIYPETKGISSKWIRRQVFKMLEENKDEIKDFLPPPLISKYGFNSLYETLSHIHFPGSISQADSSRKRLSFDELFITQLASNVRREEWNNKVKGYVFEVDKYKSKVNKFIKKLPFRLTNAQERTVEEILTDFQKENPMNRLLEGDVGSGKTVVAAVGIYIAYLNGFKSVMMAPTEILANQHFKTISDLLSPLGIKVTLRTRSSKKDEDFDVLIGTHAVIHGNINFEKLGFVIIDEQHRFGVEQRSIIRKKGGSPHVLTMTATPIPRTIALTLYGDLDLSILNEMPLGRKKIKTWLVEQNKRNNAYEWIKKNIADNKSQVFIVCPFIEESESMVTVKAATKEFDRLKKDVFKDQKLSLVHGKLKSKEKEEIITNFKNKKSDILVATPIVEVGIDIPGADIMIIETAERFGLAGLHQLRGRVGRNDRQAYCLLFTDATNPYTLKRLKAMESTNIGAELAELDLKLRGPGEIYGTTQSGRDFLKIANFSDLTLVQQTSIEAKNYVKKLKEYKKLSEKVEEINVKNISPD